MTDDPTADPRFATDLSELLQSQDLEVVEVQSLTTLASEKIDRAAFRLSISDGTKLKGRVVRTAREAERIQTLSTYLDPRHFPPVLARQGRALVIEWVEGNPVDTTDLTSDFFAKCGEIQGALHATSIADTHRGAFGFARAGWSNRATNNVMRLCELGALTRSEATAAAALLVQVPATPTSSLIHGDFCLENVVLDADNQIWVVDNENLTIESPDYDALRTWYRWPMTVEQANSFLSGYRRHTPALHLFDTVRFWGVAAFSEAALFRVEGETGGEGALMDLLRRAIANNLTLEPWA